MVIWKGGGCCRYEIATGDPLSHKESHTLIHVHSVNMFHAASVDCTRSIMQLLRPSLLAVLLPNDQQGDLLVSAQARLQAVRSGDHLQRIADGYHRICMGALSHPPPASSRVLPRLGPEAPGMRHACASS